MALNLLGRFNIVNGSFFSGYDTGDVIEIYYNDSTTNVEKYLNGGNFTSAPPITKWHVDNGYATVTITNYEFCEGTTLNTFTNIYDPNQDWYSSFPYFIQRTVLNSPTCSAVVCDIQQQGTATVGQATSGSADGSIEITVSSSVTVRFKIVDPSSLPDYDSMEAATSSSGSNYTKSFTGLIKGIHWVYALDSNGCSVLTPVAVTEDLTASYADKYYFDYKDWQDVTHRCTIKEAGYSGSSTELSNSGETPVKLMWGSTTNQDRLNTILGGSMMVQLVSETDQQWANEFKVINEKQYLVEITQGANVIQRGYIVPEIYEEPYIEEPYIVTGLRIVDGLADLQNVTYTITPWTAAEGWTDGQRITGDQSIIDILNYCLSKTGIKQNIRSCINYYADAQSSGATDDPLKQTYINNDCFVVDDEPLNCFEVIRSILSSLPQPCCIFSAEGYWYIWPIQQTADTVDYREFNSAGVYSSNGTITSRIDVDAIVKGANVRFSGVYDTINAIENRLILDSVFNDFTAENVEPSGLPKGWTPVLNGQTGSFSMDSNNEYLEANFSPDTSGAAYIVSKVSSNSYTENDNIKLSIEFQVVNNLSFKVPYSKVRFSVKAGTKYLGLDGLWYSYEIINERIVESYNTDETIEVLASFDETQDAADIEIKLYQCVPFLIDTEAVTLTTLYNNIRAIDIDDYLGDASGQALQVGYRLLGKSDLGTINDRSRQYRYYSLQLDDSPQSEPDTLSVTAGTRNGSDYLWVLDDRTSAETPTSGGRAFNEYQKGFFVKYKSVKITTESINPTDDSVKNNSFTINENNNQNLDYNLSFFDIDETVPNAEKRILNYWKLSSGSPITTGWNNTDLTQNNVKSQDFIKTFLGQLYKLPTKILTLNGRQNIHVYPYHTMRITYDDNLLLKWDRLEWNMKMMFFNGELSEVGSDTPVVLKAYKDNSYSSGYS
jgi:hypothetical protein